MKGSYQVRVSRRRGTSFRFEVKRNITVVRGDSGTGKTTLYGMIADHMRLGDRSGVTVQCDRPCIALTDMDWHNQLSEVSDSIVFIDEGFEDVVSHDFARALRDSSNYYVIFCRVDLVSLPFSVNEIYRIKTSGKYHSFESIYKQKDGFQYSLSRASHKNDFDVLLNEDSKSGLQFFKSRFSDTQLRCETASSNSQIADWLLEHKGEKVFVVADGAAFGPYADRVFKIQRELPHDITICLPESFEWLLLKSGIVSSKSLEAILEKPSSYIDSEEYFSWERFFSDYLRKVTRNTANLKYEKSKLAAGYMTEANASKIMALIAFRNIE